MEKFSGGYIPINLNFVVGSLRKRSDINSQENGICAVLRNILFRGAPTKPSRVVKSALSSPDRYGNITYYHLPSDYQWNGTIKGFYSDNPAIHFYERLKAKLPSAYFLFLPECPFTDISDDPRWPKDSAVDFYDPVHKIVVEIDGSQHMESISNKNDEKRDTELNRMGIKNIIRIPASLSESETDDVIKKITTAINAANYGLQYSNSKLRKDLSSLEAEYISLFRIEVALLVFMENGFLTNEITEIEFLRRRGVTERAIKTAIQDFLDMYGNLCQLLGLENNKKAIKYTLVDSFSDSQSLKADVSCDLLYDETIDSSNDILKIRNDYFFYAVKNLHTSKEHYPRFKNHYRVASGELDYSHLLKKDEKDVQSLEYFLELLFEHDHFRPKQAEIIINGLQKSHGVVGLLPTGSGKSVCFQLVSFLTPGLTIVVSPLTLLMQDQCTNLYARNLISSAYYINATDTGRNSLPIFESFRSKITYIAPERFFNRKFIPIVTKMAPYITQVVLDEVHCLSEWGHDFRTSYLLLFHFVKKVGISDNALLMGTSATSSPRVTYDITREFSKLKTKVSVIRSSSVKRPELSFRVKTFYGEGEKANLIKELVQKNADHGKKTLVFVPYRSDTDKVQALFVDDKAVKTDTCIGPDSGEKKQKLLVDFTSGETNTMIATKAFGMGLDIPDIRETIHTDLASSVESAYQEMGRAGRDGKDSVCTIMFEHAGLGRVMGDQLFMGSPRPSYISKVKKTSLGSLTKQVTLVLLSNEDPEKEAAFIIAVGRYLSVGNDTFKLSDAFESLISDGVIDSRFYRREKGSDGKWYLRKDLGSFATFFEKALYKLYLLKCIPLWSKTYDNSLDDPIISGLLFKPTQTIEEINANLHGYINQYESSYRESATSLNEAIQLLTQWSFDNFYVHRWNSLKTLYEMITTFTDSESFAGRIENYFAQNDQLERSVSNPLNYKYWFTAIQSDSPMVLKDQMARYVEDYPDQVAVNFITSFINLMVNNFDDANGRNRMAMAFNEMEILGESAISEILGEITRLPLSDQQKLQFLCFLADEKPKLLKKYPMEVMSQMLPRREYESFKEYKDLKNTYDNLAKLKKAVEEML